MNELYKLSASYFKEFESRSTFPGLKSYHWYLLTTSFASFCYFGYQVFLSELPQEAKPMWKMFFSELFFLITCGVISLYRFKQTVRITSDESELKPIDRLNNAKRARLEVLLSRPSSQFMAIAKEINELQELEKTNRSNASKEYDEIGKKIHDPAASARLLNLITALLSIAIAALGKTEGLNLVETLQDDFTWIVVKALIAFVVMCFFAVIILRIAFKELLELIPLIISTLFPNFHSRRATLDYLVRDLIWFHTLERTTHAQVAIDSEHQKELLADREPSNTILITALTAQIAYKAFQALSRRTKQ